VSCPGRSRHRIAAFVVGATLVLRAQFELRRAARTEAVLVGLARASALRIGVSFATEHRGLPGISTTPERSAKGAPTWTWVVYLAGAALGGLLFIGFHRAALWPAVAVFVANAGWLACSVPSTSSSKA
jgi:hypothetical protein